MLTIADLRQHGQLIEAMPIPELLIMQQNIENNPWHHRISTMDHTKQVMFALEEIVPQLPPAIRAYVDRTVQNYRREDLLYVAAIGHDLGKPLTSKLTGEEFAHRPRTECPGHEIISANLMAPVLERLDMSVRERGIVLGIIRDHGWVHRMFRHDAFADEAESYLEQSPKHGLDTMVLAVADTIGCELREHDPRQFDDRMRRYKTVLDNYRP